LVKETFESMGLERYEAIPCFYRYPASRIGVEVHMDDFHGTGRMSEATWFLGGVSDKLVLKKSEPILQGRYAHLKRNRVKLSAGTFVQADPTHLIGVASRLGIRPGGREVKTPYLDAERPPPEQDPLLEPYEASEYRTCVGTLIYISGDRVDLQREIGALGSHLSAPRQWDLKRLRRVAQYGAATAVFGNWLPKPIGSAEGVVRLENLVDTDHAGDKETRRSVTCGMVKADGCPLATLVRKQTIISLSSGESEFCGMHSINVESVMIKRLLEWFEFKTFWITRSDSSAARSMAVREGIGKVRHLDSRLLYTQHLVRNEGLHIQRIAGEFNPVDIGTKKHPTARCLALRDLCSVITEPEESEVEDVTVSAVTGDDKFAQLVRDVGQVLSNFGK